MYLPHGRALLHRKVASFADSGLNLPNIAEIQLSFTCRKGVVHLQGVQFGLAQFAAPKRPSLERTQ